MERSPQSSRPQPTDDFAQSPNGSSKVTDRPNESDSASRFSPRNASESRGGSTSEAFTFYQQQVEQAWLIWEPKAQVFDALETAETCTKAVIARWIEDGSMDRSILRSMLTEVGVWLAPDPEFDDPTINPKPMARVRVRDPFAIHEPVLFKPLRINI